MQTQAVAAMIHEFKDWSATLEEVSPLEDLTGGVLAIEAAHYLVTALSYPAQRDPLLPALGGNPLALRHNIETDLATLRGLDITPLFVFHGLEQSKLKDAERLMQAAEAALEPNKRAWALYEANEPSAAVGTFGAVLGDEDRLYRTMVRSSDGDMASFDPYGLFRFLQQILHDQGVDFQVAPYSAWAQLAYLEKHAPEYVDAIAGSEEILLWDVEKVITDLNIPSGEFTWIKRRACIVELGNISSDLFVDALLFCGSPFLAPLPHISVVQQQQIQQQQRKNSNNSNAPQPPNPPQHRLRIAVDLLNNMGHNAIGVITHYHDADWVPKYVDKYKRARLAVKHHAALTKEGRVENFEAGSAPNNVHEFLDQRLPDELYYYMSKGLINPRFLSWRTSGDLIELPPCDGGNSAEYRALLTEQLMPLRAQAINCLSMSMHHWFQHNDVGVRFWFERGEAGSAPGPRRMLRFREISTAPDSIVRRWNVKKDTIAERQKDFPSTLGGLGFAVLSLTDDGFAAKTVVPKDIKRPLNTWDEIYCNIMWRFLQFRDYVDDQHKLTRWGRVLAAAMDKVKAKPDMQEPVFVAVEMLRLQLLNNAEISGAADEGILTSQNREYNGFSSRVSNNIIAQSNMSSASAEENVVSVSATDNQPSPLYYNGAFFYPIPTLPFLPPEHPQALYPVHLNPPFRPPHNQTSPHHDRQPAPINPTTTTTPTTPTKPQQSPSNSVLTTPPSATATDRANSRLLARVACLLTLRHRDVGFTGPLAKDLLAYTNLVAALRGALRDLVESVAATLLLGGDADRECLYVNEGGQDDGKEKAGEAKKDDAGEAKEKSEKMAREHVDLTALGLKLPFLLNPNAGMGIAVKTYLNDLLARAEPTSAESKAAAKTLGCTQYLKSSLDFVGDLARSFEFFEAIRAGIIAEESPIKKKEAPAWDETSKWLENRK